MRVITANSLWIFCLAVILNYIELSLQSGTSKEKGPRGDEGLSVPGVDIDSEIPPLRKVRCPPLYPRKPEIYFTLKKSSRTYEECTPDTILIARGPFIIGFDRNDTIHPIHNPSGQKIIYAESTNKQYRVSREFLRSLGVYGPVPAEIRRLREIDPFGVWSPKRQRNSRASTSEPAPTSMSTQTTIALSAPQSAAAPLAAVPAAPPVPPSITKRIQS